MDNTSENTQQSKETKNTQKRKTSITLNPQVEGCRRVQQKCTLADGVRQVVQPLLHALFEELDMFRKHLALQKTKQCEVQRMLFVKKKRENKQQEERRSREESLMLSAKKKGAAATGSTACNENEKNASLILSKKGVLEKTHLKSVSHNTKTQQNQPKTTT